MRAKVLVVGCGSIGERHLRCLLGTGRAQPTACEPNPAILERIRQQYKVSGFASLGEALHSDKFDGAVICTPTQTHIPAALECLRHGTALLIEKPLGTDLDGVDELRATIAKSGKFTAIGYVYRFIPAIKGLHDELKKGSLGKPLQVSVVAGQHFPTYRPAYRETYYTRHETGGGAIQDYLTHSANTVEWLVGPTTRLFCEAAHQRLEGVSIEDTVSITARNVEVLVSYSLNQFQPPNEASFLVHCENGSVKAELHEQRWGVWPRGASGWDYHSAPVKDRDQFYSAEEHAFLDGMAGRTTDLASVEEGIQTLKFNLAALASMRTGQPVTI